MPGSDDTHQNVYTVLKDVLQQPAQIDSGQVHYRPSTADKRYLEAYIEPDCVNPPTGPDAPTITVKWTRRVPHDEFRIDYLDPNIEFHCGWHRDDDHPEYGTTHFQYQQPRLDTPVYEAAEFTVSSPPRILWETLDRLFDDVLPEKAAPLYD